MARRRYGRKRKGGKSRSIPLLMIVPVAYTLKGGWDAGNHNITAASNHWVEDFTGYNMAGKSYSFDAVKPFAFGMIAAVIAHKVANRVGVNKAIRKATMGYLSL